MKSPATPPNEEPRLKTLRSLNILDTPQEERFDRLTRMAKRLFDVPIALVSIVDEDRQWFKSCLGLSATETPRDISFCGHSILGTEIFIIEDATKDHRFSDNPLVINDPKIRFYAGCPLRALDGSNMGTLCIIDTKPRTLNQDDLIALKDLASMAEHELAAIHLATLDELTNISNRRGFMALAQQGINFCIRQGIPASLGFFDMNKFKEINDAHGHAEGDKALITFAAHIKDTLRDSDIIARIGGDEFAALLINTPKHQAEEIIVRSKQLLDKYNQEEKREYEISFSHGIVDFDAEKHQSVEELLAEGDLLMYRNKKAEDLTKR